jgi:segregation and condensation protein B
MSDTDVPQPPSPEKPTAGSLGEHFAALIGNQTWEVDLPEALEAEKVSGPFLPEEGKKGPDSKKGRSRRPRPPEKGDETPPSAEQIVEALLFVGGPPLKPERACQIIRGLTPLQFHECIDALNRRYRAQERPYTISGGEEGYMLTIKGRFRGVSEKLFGGAREARLSQPALDVLALVAYRQPVTRAEVDAVRGADSGALLRQLVRLGMVAVSQRGESGLSEVGYTTTPRFLEVFGLRSLDDLPRTGDAQRI